jgi:hypothetical protein
MSDDYGIAIDVTAVLNLAVRSIEFPVISSDR